ncbi:MAG: glycosyltransferase family 4 protein [Bacteroidota bacterium]
MAEKKKKLLFFNVIPLPHSIDIHEQLVQDGYEVDFWYLKDLTTMYPWQSLEKSITYHIYKGSIKDFFSVLKSANRSGLVIITGWHSKTHVALALYCKLLGIKYSFWLDVPETPAPGFKTNIKQWFMNLANALFITGKTGIDFFIKQYKASPSKCYDFPYLEVKFVKAGIEMINDERNKALFYGDKIKLLLSNRFLKRKGYSTVLSALKEVSPSALSQFEITILGTGVERDEYENEFTALNAGIKFKGWVEYAEYLEILAANDVFIHASIHEPFGIPPMDAMRYGKLVIGSRGVMSCVDRIEHGVNGYLFDVNDGKALALILSEIAADKSLIYQMGKLAHQTSKGYGYRYNRTAIEKFIK